MLRFVKFGTKFCLYSVFKKKEILEVRYASTFLNHNPYWIKKVIRFINKNQSFRRSYVCYSNVEKKTAKSLLGKEIFNYTFNIFLGHEKKKQDKNYLFSLDRHIDLLISNRIESLINDRIYKNNFLSTNKIIEFLDKRYFLKNIFSKKKKNSIYTNVGFSQIENIRLNRIYVIDLISNLFFKNVKKNFFLDNSFLLLNRLIDYIKSFKFRYVTIGTNLLLDQFSFFRCLSINILKKKSNSFFLDFRKNIINLSGCFFFRKQFLIYIRNKYPKIEKDFFLNKFYTSFFSKLGNFNNNLKKKSNKLYSFGDLVNNFFNKKQNIFSLDYRKYNTYGKLVDKVNNLDFCIKKDLFFLDNSSSFYSFLQKNNILKNNDLFYLDKKHCSSNLRSFSKDIVRLDRLNYFFFLFNRFKSIYSIDTIGMSYRFWYKVVLGKNRLKSISNRLAFKKQKFNTILKFKKILLDRLNYVLKKKDVYNLVLNSISFFLDNYKSYSKLNKLKDINKFFYYRGHKVMICSNFSDIKKAVLTSSKVFVSKEYVSKLSTLYYLFKKKSPLKNRFINRLYRQKLNKTFSLMNRFQKYFMVLIFKKGLNKPISYNFKFIKKKCRKDFQKKSSKKIFLYNLINPLCLNDHYRNRLYFLRNLKDDISKLITRKMIKKDNLIKVLVEQINCWGIFYAANRLTNVYDLECVSNTFSDLRKKYYSSMSRTRKQKTVVGQENEVSVLSVIKELYNEISGNSGDVKEKKTIRNLFVRDPLLEYLATGKVSLDIPVIDWFEFVNCKDFYKKKAMLNAIHSFLKGSPSRVRAYKKINLEYILRKTPTRTAVRNYSKTIVRRYTTDDDTKNRPKIDFTDFGKYRHLAPVNRPGKKKNPYRKEEGPQYIMYEDIVNKTYAKKKAAEAKAKANKASYLKTVKYANEVKYEIHNGIKFTFESIKISDDENKFENTYDLINDFLHRIHNICFESFKSDNRYYIRLSKYFKKASRNTNRNTNRTRVIKSKINSNQILEASKREDTSIFESNLLDFETLFKDPFDLEDLLKNKDLYISEKKKKKSIFFFNGLLDSSRLVDDNLKGVFFRHAKRFCLYGTKFVKFINNLTIFKKKKKNHLLKTIKYLLYILKNKKLKSSLKKKKKIFEKKKKNVTIKRLPSYYNLKLKNLETKEFTTVDSFYKKISSIYGREIDRKYVDPEEAFIVNKDYIRSLFVYKKFIQNNRFRLRVKRKKKKLSKKDFLNLIKRSKKNHLNMINNLLSFLINRSRILTLRSSGTKNRYLLKNWLKTSIYKKKIGYLKKKLKNINYEKKKKIQLKYYKKNINKVDFIRIRKNIIIQTDSNHKKKKKWLLPFFYSIVVLEKSKIINKFRNHILKNGNKRLANKNLIDLLIFLKKKFFFCPINIIRHVIIRHNKLIISSKLKRKKQKKIIELYKTLSTKKQFFYMINFFFKEIFFIKKSSFFKKIAQLNNKNKKIRKHFFFLSIISYISYVMKFQNSLWNNSSFFLKKKTNYKKAFSSKGVSSFIRNKLKKKKVNKFRLKEMRPKKNTKGNDLISNYYRGHKEISFN